MPAPTPSMPTTSPAATGLLFSVVLCTYRRPQALSLALESLSQQTFPATQFEVIVVDSAAEETTRSLVNRWTGQVPGLRTIPATIVGIPQARNQGWQAAQGDYVAYMDDDCKAPEDWLATAAALIQQHHPDLLGGPYYPYYVQPKPDWFLDAYGSGKSALQPGWMKADEHLVAGNLFIRRAVLEACRGFDPAMGLSEETELQQRLRRVRPQTGFYYEPGLYVYHQVRPEKYKLRYQFRQKFRAGRFSYLAYSHGSHGLSWKHLLGFLGLPLLVSYGLTLGVCLRDRQAYPAYQNYIYEQVLAWVAQWGKLYERLRQSLPRASHLPYSPGVLL